LNTEAVVYLARKLHWTREQIGKLTPLQFNEILKEVYYQESVDTYREQYSIASILAAIYNTIPRKSGAKAFTAKDFLAGDIPTREGRKPDTNVEILAREKGIILPSK